jgi:hypothetical protein
MPGGPPAAFGNGVPDFMEDVNALISRRGNCEGTPGVPSPGNGDEEVSGAMDPALAASAGSLATDIYAFMALYAKLAQQMRTTAREQRQSELESQVGSLKSAANEMMSAAQDRFSAALTTGITQMVGGAITMASSAYALGKIASHTKVADAQLTKADAEAGVKQAHDDLLPGSVFLQKLQAQQGLCSGAGQLAEGGGKIGSASMERDAQQAESQAKIDDAHATEAQARRETAQEVMQAMADTLRDIREKLAAILQSDVEASRGIARNI